MLIYLDTVWSRAANPNENYAREVLELHTLGVTHVVEADVKEAAKVFTGLALAKMDPPDYGNALATPLSDEAIYRRGDFTGDGTVDIVDLAYFATYLEATTPCDDPRVTWPWPWPCADISNDGEVGVADLGLLAAYLNQATYLWGPWFDESDWVAGAKSFEFGTGGVVFTLDQGPSPTREEKYEEIELLLGHLANRRRTGLFVSGKLIAKLVAPVDPDDTSLWPPALRSLRSACANTWVATGGDLRAASFPEGFQQ